MAERGRPQRGGQRPNAPQRGGQPRGGEPRGERRRARVAPAREVALEVLRRVRTDDAYANLLLPARIRDAGLTTQDAALATELTYGTLRGLGSYDAIIARAANRPTDEIDGALLDVLRLGAHQLLSTRIPAHAAVHESVEQAGAVASRGGASFANAVLRRIGAKDLETWLDEVTAETADRDRRLAVRFSHPSWIIRALRAALAADPATTTVDGDAETALERLLAADQQAPAVALAALPGLGDAAGLDPLPHSPVGYGSRRGDPAAQAEVAAGRIRVQDEGSQLAALALTRARPVRAGERWLDLCAGPGGKAALLAAEARLGGAALVSNEAVDARAGLVERALDAVPGEHPVVVGDGRRVGDPDLAADDPAAGSFDRILLDAPCTGIGALRRRPEARWRKQPADVPALRELQEQLVDAAVSALAPGGLLGYVTCSPHLAETRQQVAALVARHPELVPVDTGAVLADLVREPLAGVAAGETAVQLWPHRHGTDAMFIALFERP